MLSIMNHEVYWIGQSKHAYIERERNRRSMGEKEREGKKLKTIRSQSVRGRERVIILFKFILSHFFPYRRLNNAVLIYFFKEFCSIYCWLQGNGRINDRDSNNQSMTTILNKRNRMYIVHLVQATLLPTDQLSLFFSQPSSAISH